MPQKKGKPTPKGISAVKLKPAAAKKAAVKATAVLTPVESLVTGEVPVPYATSARGQGLRE